ncbi:MAG: TIGR02453 family protein [Actinobacteria bacterium]|nr:TIGR02453 family protein [Actinomycetota bacterium]MCI0544594.1 TIGR02453 family protein [Actinomycetota bacterium]
MSTYFTPALFEFLKDLAANNDRAWFNDNKQRYLDYVQEPALAFITDFAPKLTLISPHLRADARVVGGSLFRIQRDTRFSPDKTPYKANTGMHFRHDRAGDVHAPGFYLHLEPSACFAGAGIWRPQAAMANQVRTAIHDDPATWRRAVKTKRFTDVWAIDTDDSLKRLPPQFDPEHLYADDLRLRSFVAGRRLTQKEVVSAGFLDSYTEMCRSAGPFMGFLCVAVGVEF